MSIIWRSIFQTYLATVNTTQVCLFLKNVLFILILEHVFILILKRFYSRWRYNPTYIFYKLKLQILFLDCIILEASRFSFFDSSFYNWFYTSHPVQPFCARFFLMNKTGKFLFEFSLINWYRILIHYSEVPQPPVVKLNRFRAFSNFELITSIKESAFLPLL